MPKTQTITGYANTDPRDGSLTIDVRGSVNASGIFNINGAPTDIVTFPPPPAPTADVAASVTGAPGGARFVKISWTAGTGRESVLSPATSAGTATADHGAHVTAPTAYNAGANFDAQLATAAPSGVTGYNVYFSTTLGGTYTKQNTTPIALGTDYTETSAGVLNNGAVPAGDTSGWVNGPCTVTVAQP